MQDYADFNKQNIPVLTKVRGQALRMARLLHVITFTGRVKVT